MADRYWVTGGNGVWTSTGNWSATSGGSSGASVPTNADNAFFDQTATYTVTGNATALNVLVSAGTVTFTLGINGFGGTAATYFTFNSGTVAGFSASSTTTFSTTATLVINTNGVALTGAGSVIFGISTRTGTVSLGSDFAITGAINSAKVTLAYGTLDLGSFKLTSEGQFTTANAVLHTLAFGTGNITITGANSGNVAWDTSIGTNNVTGTPTVNISYNVAGSLTVATQVGGTEANSISFNFTTGTYTLTFLNTTGYVARSVSFAGFGGTWASRTAPTTIYGDLTLSAVAGFSVAATANVLIFGSTSATTRIITSNGKTLDCPITINGSGSWQLADAMTVGATRTLAFTSGTLDLNNKTLTSGLFSSTGSLARTLAFGSTGSIRLNGAGGTLWNTATNTNFAYTGTSNVTIDNNTATATTLTPGSLTEAQALNFNIISGTYTLTLTNTPAFKNLNFVNTGTTGFAGTLPARTVDTIIYGNLTLSSGMTLAASSPGIIFRATSGTQILTSNTKTFDMPMAQNGAGGTLQLADAFAMGASRTFNFNNGTFDGNSQTMTGATALSASAGGVTAFKRMNTSIVFNHTSSTMTMVGDNTTGKISTISGSIDLGGYVWTATGFGTNVGTKSLTFNGGTLLLTGPYAPTFDNFNPLNFTTIAGTGTGYIRMNAAAAKTFFGNGSTFNCILSNDGAGALTIQNSNTFLGITNGVSPTAFIFTAGTTQTVSNWTVNGTAGNLVTITSTTAGTAATLSKSTGTVGSYYLSLKDSAATGGATWNAYNSTNVSGNSGWIFSTVTASSGNFFFMF